MARNHNHARTNPRQCARAIMRKFIGKTYLIRVLLQIQKLKYVNCEVYMKKTNI